MDERDFDLLTRRLAAGASRRALLRSGLALAGSLAGFGAAREAGAAAKPRQLGQICGRNGDCASGICARVGRTGPRHCLCGSPSDCPQPGGNGCRIAICSASGQCSTGVNVGAPCDDGNACTTSDACQADGSCAGTPVTCAAIDQCHSPGTCDPAIGACTNPIKANGTSCNDDNACTTGDTCQDGVCKGGNPIVCTPLDQCHVAGTCDPATGQCSNPPADFGTACNDNNACTTGDHCVGGVCTGTPTICQPVDDPAGCWNQPTCDPATGTCTQPTPKPKGTPCDDGNLCTVNDVCDGAGTCAGTPKNCGLTVGTCPQKCDPATGSCVAGQDGDPCTPNDIAPCVTGVCQGGGCAAVPAQAGTSCVALTINPNPCAFKAGICDDRGNCLDVPVPDGTACTGVQVGECQIPVCKNGACVATNVPNGTACGDVLDNECDRNSCQAGACTNVSRLGARCQELLHGCQVFTCQAGGCLNSGANDCNLSVACGTGTCVQELSGWVCHYDNSPSACTCEGEHFSEPVECCGIGFTNNSTSIVVTCPAGSGRECCTGLLGAQCCEPGVKCELGGCGTPGIEVPG